MVIIQLKNGWSCSNDAKIDTFSTPVYKDKKIIELKKTRYLIANNIYTVKGNYDGDVKFAIRDSNTNELFCFDGIIEEKGIRIVGETTDEWLKNI